MRARNRLRIALQQDPIAYSLWIDQIEGGEAAMVAASSVMAGWAVEPRFSILLHQDETLDQGSLNRIVADLAAQVYSAWEMIVVRRPDAWPLAVGDERVRIADRPTAAGSEALRTAGSLARGDYWLPLSSRTRLPATALFHYAEALQAGSADVLIGDHDQLEATGERGRPWFKPAWNDELALAQDYISQAIAVWAPVAQQVLAERGEYDKAAAYAFGLAAARRQGAVVRSVAHIQAHLAGAVACSANDRIPAVENQVVKAGAKVSPGVYGTVRVDWPLPARPPLVSILVPTRDQVALLHACLSSVEERTTYAAYEVIVVDNGSTRNDTLAYLSDLDRREGFRVIRDEQPFNFSRLNNLGAAEARGQYLCLLNNDTEIIEGGWLTAMMRQAVRSHVGAVGARLLYDDGSIQHAGVAIGLGDAAGHAHRFQRADAEGYFARVHAAHYVSAVTAACLVVEKSKFLAVGGLDEESFAVAFNDVDLCLKLQSAGLQNVYTPHATLLHHESKSRGKDFSPQHIERYLRELELLQERWSTRTHVDPLHHVNLDRASETYLIKL